MSVAEEKVTAARLSAFSDAVFAVIVTIMVLELEASNEAEFSALTSLWSTAVSYAVSYLFIAIIWINHHYLMRFVGAPTLQLPCLSRSSRHASPSVWFMPRWSCMCDQMSLGWRTADSVRAMSRA